MQPKPETDRARIPFREARNAHARPLPSALSAKFFSFLTSGGTAKRETRRKDPNAGNPNAMLTIDLAAPATVKIRLFLADPRNRLLALSGPAKPGIHAGGGRNRDSGPEALTEGRVISTGGSAFLGERQHRSRLRAILG